LARDCKLILEGLWLIKRVLPATGLAVVYGEPGCGKTFVVTDMMMCIARNITWRRMKTRGGKVLYIAPDGGCLISNRIIAYTKAFCREGQDIPFGIISMPVDVLGLQNRNDISIVRHAIENSDFDPDVVVIDTVSRSMPGGNENSPETMTAWIERAQSIASGKLTIGVHHSGKDISRGSRGHSSLKGAADCEIEIADRVIHVRKLRDGRDGEKFAFGLREIRLGVDADGEAVTSCFVTASDAHSQKPRIFLGTIYFYETESSGP
jgi:RecA-family ATPase